jgi:uncharacterized protein involved in exopolysaccharide biosynthesis
MPSPVSVRSPPELSIQPHGKHGPGSDLSLFEMAAPLAQRWLPLLKTGVAAGAIGLGLTYLITPIFTARTSILPPQQQQSAAAAALGSLGGLAGLAGGLARTPADQYLALMQSVTVSDRLIDKFKLIEAYDKKLRVDARSELDKRGRRVVGKKDGLITIEVEDENPTRAVASVAGLSARRGLAVLLRFQVP